MCSKRTRLVGCVRCVLEEGAWIPVRMNNIQRDEMTAPNDESEWRKRWHEQWHEWNLWRRNWRSCHSEFIFPLVLVSVAVRCFDFKDRKNGLWPNPLMVRVSKSLWPNDIRFYKDWPLSYLRTLKIGNNFLSKTKIGLSTHLKSIDAIRITIEIFIQIINIFYFQKIFEVGNL